MLWPLALLMYACKVGRQALVQQLNTPCGRKGLGVLDCQLKCDTGPAKQKFLRAHGAKTQADDDEKDEDDDENDEG